MDIELLFSMSPLSFLSRDDSASSTFSYISPTEKISIKDLPESKGAEPGVCSVKIPQSLKNCNVYVEVVAGKITEAKPYYDNSLICQVKENFGQIKVLDRQTGKPIPKAYVKVNESVT